MREQGQTRAIRVLVVDDSSFIRMALKRMIQSEPGLEVVGCAHDGYEALQMAAELDPDVVTMDVEMPRMNGLEAVRALMASTPRPVIMVSSLTREGAHASLEALECGAFDCVAKQGVQGLDLAQVRRELIGKIKAAAESRKAKKSESRSVANRARQEIRAPQEMAVMPSVICIGSSTGGPRALQQILPALPGHLPVGIVVVQHMPPGFTGPFAARLDGMCGIHVKEAQPDDVIEAGVVLISPAGWHVTIQQKSYSRYAVRLSKTPGDTLHMPSVDVTMLSAAEVLGHRAMGVILTGMGNDGEAGMSAIHAAGGYTVAQDEATSIVYGMPKACAVAGVVSKILPLTEIAGEIVAAATRICYGARDGMGSQVGT
jgi:two-component system, chemotaxis family, protein-glutamate methylesterase/glutaminase